MPDVTTYSFLDLTGSIHHDVAGDYLFQGQMGAGSVAIAMTTEKTVHDLASDGSIMVSKMAGENGTISIEVQQTSDLHAWLLDTYNLVNFTPDTSQWAGMSMMLRNIVDGSSHVASGMSFQKVPDKSYQAQGQRVTWVLMAADIHSITV